MRVLHIIKSLGRGGAEMLLAETLPHHQADFEFHYAYFLPWKNQLASTLTAKGGKVVCFPANNNLAILLQLPSIVKYIKANDIQLIHCHLPWAGFVGRCLYKWLHMPVLYTEHNKQERYHPITFWLNKISFRFQSAVIAVSDDVKTSIVQNIHPANTPITTILNGVDTQSFKFHLHEQQSIRQQLGIPQNAFVVGTVAVFRKQKRLPEWVTIIHELRKKHENVYAILVGDGPCMPAVKTIIQQYQLENYVFLPGLKTDVRAYVAAMDVFMMTSEFEGLPVALLEAMSIGKPVVATNAGGTAQVVQDGENGFLVAVDEWKLLADTLAFCIQNPAEMERMGNNARNHIEHHYSINRMVTQLEALYHQFV